MGGWDGALRARSFKRDQPAPPRGGPLPLAWREMTVEASSSSCRPRTVVGVAIAALLATVAVLTPVAALGAGTGTQKFLGIKVPASVRVHSTTTAKTTTGTQPAVTTPASAQPGTVAPATTTPASAVPQTTSTPATALPTTTTPATATPTTTATTPSGATPTATTPGSTTVIVVHKTTSHATHLSTLALALAILGALLVLGCLVWALGRWLALEPRWTVSLMHSLREASYRTSATWAEFSDWVRIGR